MTDRQVLGKYCFPILVIAVAALLQGCASWSSERQLQTLIDRLAEVERTANELSRNVEAVDLKLTKAQEAVTLLEKRVAEAPEKAAADAVASVQQRSEKIAGDAVASMEKQSKTLGTEAQATVDTSLKTLETRAAELTAGMESNFTRLSGASAKADRLIADIEAIVGVDEAAKNVNTLLEKTEEFETAYQEVIAKRESLTEKSLSVSEVKIVDSNNKTRALLSANALYFLNDKGRRIIQLETNEGTRSDPCIVVNQADLSGRHDERHITLCPTRIWLWASTANPFSMHEAINLAVDRENDEVVIEAWGPTDKGNSFLAPPISLKAGENGCAISLADPGGTGGARVMHTKRRVTGPNGAKVETDTELVLTGKGGKTLWKAP